MLSEQGITVTWDKQILVGSCNVCQERSEDWVYEISLRSLRFRVCRVHANELIKKLVWFEPVKEVDDAG